MFVPFAIEINLSYPDINFQKIEFEILKNIKQKYRFKSTEITDEKIELKDASPILKCEFGLDYIEFAVLTPRNSLDEIIKILNFFITELGWKEVTIDKIGYFCIYEVPDSRKMINFNFSRHEISIYDFELYIEDEDNTHVRFFYDKDDEKQVFIAKLTPEQVVNNGEELGEFINIYSNRLINTLTDIVAPQGEIISFEKQEVNDDE